MAMRDRSLRLHIYMLLRACDYIQRYVSQPGGVDSASAATHAIASTANNASNVQNIYSYIQLIFSYPVE